MLLLDVITQGYRIAGVLKGPGRGLSPSEQDEGLHIANAILDGLKIERCFAYQVVRTPMNVTAAHALVAGGWQEYSVGAEVDGADWVIERPEKILRAGFLVPVGSSTPAEIPMEVLLDFTQWQGIVTKGVTSTQARVLYYRATLPCGTAAVWPVPRVDGQVVIYTLGLVNEFDDIMATIEFPKGWREFMEYAIACAVSERYPDIRMKPSVEVRMREYKSRVMANQLTPLLIRCDEGALQGKPDGRRFYDARTWTP